MFQCDQCREMFESPEELPVRNNFHSCPNCGGMITARESPKSLEALLRQAHKLGELVVVDVYPHIEQNIFTVYTNGGHWDTDNPCKVLADYLESI